ncbi:alpha/beta hydrolase [Algibacter sp. 2305UL17-15]|uniref:alpha/beta hydrolase n=1 Tax=Algibacter sp. 2305UL17-15 TaxID=3231268 RepID=UPI00345A3939
MSNKNFNTGKNTVTYMSDGLKLTANLFMPSDYQEGQKRPALVFTRPGSGVKEQTAGIYAEELCKHGFVTLAFDARGYGESEGHQGVEDPFNICEDTKNSVSYMRTLDCVDINNVFSVGVCMGAGYASYATALDGRVRGIGMIGPYLNAAQQNIDAAGGVGMIRNTLLQMTGNARQQYFENGEDIIMQPVPKDAKEAEQPGTLPIQHGMMTYYLPGKPGGTQNCPNWKNGLSLYNFEALISFSAFNVLHLMENIPFFMALGSEAYTVENSKDFYEKVPGPKELEFIEGAGHFDLYWKPEHVKPIGEKMSKFFKSHSVEPQA